MIYIHTSVCRYVHMNADARGRVQKRPLDSLELKLYIGTQLYIGEPPDMGAGYQTLIL